MSGSVSGATQYLTFMLGEEVFALEISRVKEVLDYRGATKVPMMPDFMKGVINLRGEVVPVLDMSLKLGLSGAYETVNTCIIIAEMRTGGAWSIIGALADSVQEVISLDQSQIEPAPRIGNALDPAVIKGIGRQNDDFIIILDSEKVFVEEDITAHLTGQGRFCIEEADVALERT